MGWIVSKHTESIQYMPHSISDLNLKASYLFDLLAHPVGLGGGQVDLVEHGDDLQVVLHRQVHVRQRLRLLSQDKLTIQVCDDVSLKVLPCSGHVSGDTQMCLC